jgi:Ca2+-binding EF-hand superfamily protein
MRRVGFCVVSSFLLAAFSGCGTSHHRDSENAIDPKRGPTSMIYSPNGEPLNGGSLGRPTCQEALSRWFDGVDAKHDGAISRGEFLADAQTQFRRMDIDNNGYLVSEELKRFRLPYRQEATTQTASSAQNADSGQPGSQRRHGRGNGTGDHSGSSAQSDQDNLLPDPVMSADTNNDFKVTPGEFMTQAGNIFTTLDADHNGFLSRDEILKPCARPGR